MASGPSPPSSWRRARPFSPTFPDDIPQRARAVRACIRPVASLRGLAPCGMKGTMRGGAILVLLGLTAFGAYSVGRQSAPVSNAPVAAIKSPSALAQPVAFIGPAAQAPAPAPAPNASSGPTPSTKAELPDKPAAPDIKRKIEGALTVAAIAAIIVQASRDQYHAGGRPCACPDDSMRNGRACGGRSAYSRPGGAAPLCYASDVTAAMIESYRQRQASR
jgi:hypothetical protein